eukprot:gene5931-33505_t
MAPLFVTPVCAPMSVNPWHPCLSPLAPLFVTPGTLLPLLAPLSVTPGTPVCHPWHPCLSPCLSPPGTLSVTPWHPLFVTPGTLFVTPGTPVCHPWHPCLSPLAPLAPLSVTPGTPVCHNWHPCLSPLAPLSVTPGTPEQGKSTKYMAASGPVVPQKCPDTGSGFIMGGPIWAEPIHDFEFVKGGLLRSLEPDTPAGYKTALNIVRHIHGSP